MQPMKLPGPKARALIKRDSAVISPSYPRGYPFAMDHGKGTEVWDVDGNRFLDFMAGIAVASTGHSPTQTPQSTHESATILALLLSSLIASLGHDSRQASQPVHFPLSTFAGITQPFL